MIICRNIAEMRQVMSDLRAAGRVGLVPTMGALHAGHMALVATAIANNTHVVASIFVNPTQFGDPEDLENYPRTEAADLDLLRNAGVAAVFMPQPAEIYPDGEETIVETTRLANIMHGETRPGHFRGVATVVTKLFNIIGPNTAYFGEKDYQQLAVIRRMVRDLCIPVDIVGVPTVREPDGLALSSRNARLAPADRAAAPVLHRALLAARTAIRAGATVEAATSRLLDVIATEPRAQSPRVDVVDCAQFTPVTGVPKAPVGYMVSALFGDILLIDQKDMAP